jgi:flavin-dependent dehydrogenase
MWDVAIVGGGPAGSTCAAFCAGAGLRTLLVDRAFFPREKVCGDCVNPACWPVLERLGAAGKVRAATHASLASVEFVDLHRRRSTIPLPQGQNAEISIRRSLLDQILLRSAESAGAEIREGTTVLGLARNAVWTIRSESCEDQARFLVAADGRNSTVARLCNLMPPKGPDRVALQTHIPLPRDFGQRVVLQLLPQGYSGQAPVGEGLLNLCLVSRPNDLPAVRSWAEREFAISPQHHWRTVAPLARGPLSPNQPGLFLVGDAARVVEPFTGEGIYYALRSGELAALALIRNDPARYAVEHRELYRGRLWINRLARLAVEHPRLTSTLLRILPNETRLLAGLTSKVVH